MSNNINAGSLYYTVNIDRAQLKTAIAELRALADVVRKANAPAKEGTGVLRAYAQEAARLANRVTELKADMASGKITNEQMVGSLSEIQHSSRALRGELEGLGAEHVETAGDASYLQSIMTRLATVLKQTSASTGESEGSMDKLGSSFDRLEDNISRIGNKIQALDAGMERTEGGAAEFERQMKALRASNEAYGISLKQMTDDLNLSGKALLRVSKNAKNVENNTKRADRSVTTATGKFQSMALASKLSYGATTLLNDRIFQLSPALGILTNQLIFTTKGMKAFLMSALPIVAVAGSIIGVIGGLVVSIKSATGLETALADVRKTTGLTSEELRGLTDTMQDLSREIPSSVDELLGMAKVAGQLGITGASNIEAFTETIAKLSIATDVVGEEGATSLARFLQATGVAMDQMGNKAEEVANVLNALENSMAATAAEILKMTSFTQGLSSQAGLTQDEILGLNAAIISLGVKAEAGGSAVVRTMSKIQVSVVEGGDEMRRFAEASNMTVEEFQALAKESPMDALMGDLNQALVELGINEVRERRTLLALAQGYDTLEEAMYEARKESFLMGSLAEEVAIQTDTLESKVQILKNTFAAQAQDIGMTVLPAVKRLADGLIVLVDNIDLAIGAASGLALALAGPAILTSVMAAATAASTAITAAGGIVAALTALTRAVTALLFGPTGIPILAAALGVGLVFASRESASAVDTATEALVDYEEKVSSVMEMMTRVKDENDLLIALDAISETLTGEAADSWDTFRDKIQESISKGLELETAINRVIAKVSELELMRVGGLLQDATVDIINRARGADYERLFEYGADIHPLQAGFLDDIPLDELRTILSDLKDVPNLSDGLLGSGMPGLSLVDPGMDAATLIPQLEAYIALQERRIEVEERVRDALGPMSGGRNGDPDDDDDDDDGFLGGVARTPGKFNPIGPILEALEQAKGELEIEFGGLGEMSAEAYWGAMEDAAEAAQGKLVSIIALHRRKRLDDAIQEAGGLDEDGNYLISAAEAEARAAEIYDNAMYQLGYVVIPRLVEARRALAEENPLTPDMPELTIDRGRGRQTAAEGGMETDWAARRAAGQRELAREIERLREEDLISGARYRALMAGMDEDATAHARAEVEARAEARAEADAEELAALEA
ncbi:MAG: phage tail tape measure protein, partial [Actinobacteria bacterium]|nr:phage tail tape measure protein [Actinomycetota bacterium]